MANEWIDDRFDIFMRPVEGGSSEHDDRIAELEAMVIDDSWGELQAEGIRARKDAITWLREEAKELRKAERNAAELEEKLRIEDSKNAKEMFDERVAAEKRLYQPVSTLDQPQPSGAGADIAERVMADIEARAQTGFRRYGERLRPHNGRDALVDAYQEALDLAMYLRQAIEERG